MQQQFQEPEPSPLLPQATVMPPVKFAATPGLIEVLKAKLSNKDVKVQESAVEVLLEMGQEGTDILLTIMKEESMRRAYRIRRGFIVYFSIVGVLLLLAVFAKVQLLSLIGSFTAVLSTAFVASSAQKQGVTALAKSSDIRAVPFLLEALEFNQKDLQSQSRNTLITLLPQLRLEHTNMLTAAHRKILHKHLKKNDIPFQIAILKGLEQIGDETSLEVVQEIAEGAKYGTSVRTAAQECEAYLRVHIEEVRNAQTLLRASDAPEHQEELLRPAYNTDVTPANELLRPIDDSPENAPNT